MDNEWIDYCLTCGMYVVLRMRHEVLLYHDACTYVDCTNGRCLYTGIATGSCVWCWNARSCARILPWNMDIATAGAGRRSIRMPWYIHTAVLLCTVVSTAIPFRDNFNFCKHTFVSHDVNRWTFFFFFSRRTVSVPFWCQYTTGAFVRLLL